MTSWHLTTTNNKCRMYLWCSADILQTGWANGTTVTLLEMSGGVRHLEARAQHEEERFSGAVERLTEPQRVGEEGPEYLTMESHKRDGNINKTQLTDDITTSVKEEYEQSFRFFVVSGQYDSDFGEILNLDRKNWHSLRGLCIGFIYTIMVQ